MLPRQRLQLVTRGRDRPSSGSPLTGIENACPKLPESASLGLKAREQAVTRSDHKPMAVLHACTCGSGLVAY